MKKILGLLIVLMLCPLFVKADAGPFVFTATAEKSNDKVNFIIDYHSNEDLILEGLDGHSNSVYLKYDATKIEYVSVKENGTTTGSKITAEIVKDGVLKILFEVPGKDKSFEVKAAVSFTIIGSGETKLEMISRVKYDNAGCVNSPNAIDSCDDDYYSGVVVNGIKTIDLGVKQNANPNSEDEKSVVDNENTTTGSEFSNENNDTPNSTIKDFVLGLSLTINVVLLLYIGFKKRKKIA